MSFFPAICSGATKRSAAAIQKDMLETADTITALWVSGCPDQPLQTRATKQTLNTLSWQLMLPSGAPRVPTVIETLIFCCYESSIYYCVDWSWLSHCYYHIIKFWFHTTNVTFYPFLQCFKKRRYIFISISQLIFHQCSQNIKHLKRMHWVLVDVAN